MDTPQRIAVELAKSYRLINHGPTVLVSSAHGGRRNVMAAAWSMPLDFAPPKVSVVIDKHTWTRELVEASGSFALNVPCRAFARQALAVGKASGRDLPGPPPQDKFAVHGLDVFDASEIEAPLLAGCVAWLECRVIPEPHVQQAYDLFIAEVVAAHADARVFDGSRWRADVPAALRSIHYVAGGAFFATGEAFDAA